MTDHNLPWAQPGWMDTACAWITEQLATGGAQVNGPIEQQHIRPWSTVLRAPTEKGVFFFKASAPVLAHEPGLTQALYGWRPDCMQTVLAVDLERAWMLMPDESPWLRAMVKSPDYLTHWERILPVYAGVQQEMAARANDLLALGILDRHLVSLPEKYARLLEDRDSLLIDQPDGLTSEQYERLRALEPRFAELCSQLAGYGLPETLHHDDFHDGNVFVPNGRYAFSDWGESCLAHPFFTMLVTLRSIAYQFDLAYGAREHDFAFAPEILHLRDVYLSAWQDYGSPADLLSAFNLAWRVAMVNRALTWHYVIAHLSLADRENIFTVAAWLQEFLDLMERK